MSPRALLFVVLTFVPGCACRDDQLRSVAGLIRVEPQQVDFGRFVLGGAQARRITVTNFGKVALEGVWSIQGEGFRTDDGVPARAEVGETSFTLLCAPDHVGVFDGQVTISLRGFEPVVVPLSCEVVPVPECVPSNPCRASAWDVGAGRCVETNAPEGTSCSVSDVCLLNATCRAGRCEGTLRECRDGDPCTADTCDPQLGCQHPGPIACPGAGPCRVGQCVSDAGCTLVDAADGTPCGQRRSCREADVCIAGQCVTRDPPDGFACVGDGPCGGAGRCVNDACVAGPASTVNPAWTLGAPQPDGGPPEAWSDLFADRSGALHLSSYFISPPRLGARGAMPVDLMQTARRCVVWLGWVVCGDLPALATSPVSALDPATGATVWSFTGAATQIAQFNGPGVQFFTARLAVMNENELLALYESRTLTAEGADPRCRAFALVVLDRAGQPLRSLFIDDPIFGVCDHPHSYGVAVDAQSNVYLAFTPSSTDNPATSMTGTTLFSFSPALQLRWRVHEPALEGGELAVFGGVVFPEKSPNGLSAQTGVSTGPLFARFGGGVGGLDLAVTVGASRQTLEALEVRQLLPRWSAPLLGVVGAAPLTLARWDSPWGPREVVLALTLDHGVVQLEGVELETGAAAFTCPLGVGEVPLTTAMTPGGLGLMFARSPPPDTCPTCDPRFARTRNSFAWLPLPGLAPSEQAWPALWGSEGHSHHEGR